MSDNRLWNVYVRLTNRQDREFTINDTHINVDEAVVNLREREEVLEVNYGVEHADFTANDLIEEVASWIDSEY